MEQNNTHTEMKFEVWVGRNLFHDWESRGLIYELKRDEAGRFEIARWNNVRVKIRATASILESLADDAAYQVSAGRDAERSSIQTNNTFIARVEAALKAGA